jgi:hypothetical protein
MPPGYAAFFMWVASAVLWWSGWREETADGIPDRAVAVFLAGWPVTAWKNTVLWESAAHNIAVNGVFLWTTVAMTALALRMETSARWTALSAGFLTGSFTMLLLFSPLLYLFAPDWTSGRGVAIIAGLTTAVLIKGASGQVLGVTTALLLYEVLRSAWIQNSGSILIGDGRWMESWWISVLAARLASVLAKIAVTRMGRNGWKREGGGI